MTHPLNYQLESALTGDAEPDTLAHIAACELCQAYVSGLGVERERWEQSAEATKFADRLAGSLASLEASMTLDASTAASSASAPSATAPTATAPSATQLAPEARPLAPASLSEARLQRMRREKWIRAASMLSAPLLAAAAVALYLRVAPTRVAPVIPGELPACASCAADDEATRFKGPPQVFVIVERDGEQSRSASSALVGAGAALRVEISLAVAAPIAAGVLTSTGDYIPLLLPAQLEAGTHYSERAARFDAEPSNGWVIVGSPDAVRHASATSNLQGVVAIPLRYTSTP